MNTKKISKIAIYLVIVIVAITAYCVWNDYSLQLVTVPSDAELIKIFKENRSDFEKLRTMTYADINLASFFSESKIPSGISSVRRKEYKKLLNLSSDLKVGVNYDGNVRFIFASSGNAIGPGWAKGIQFIPKNSKIAGENIASLDSVSKLPSGVYLKKMEPRWYLYYQKND